MHEVLPPFQRQTDGVAEDLERIRLRQVLHAVEVRPRHQAIDQYFRLPREHIAHRTQRATRQDPRNHRPRARVLRRVDLENDAGLAPWLLLAVVADPDTGARAVGLPVVQRGMNLLVAGHGPYAMAFEPNGRSRVP